MGTLSLAMCGAAVASPDYVFFCGNLGNERDASVTGIKPGPLPTGREKSHSSHWNEDFRRVFHEFNSMNVEAIAFTCLLVKLAGRPRYTQWPSEAIECIQTVEKVFSIFGRVWSILTEAESHLQTE